MAKTVRTGFLALLLGSACAGEGTRPEIKKRKPAQKPVPREEGKPTHYDTGIGLALIGDKAPQLSGCAEVEDTLSLGPISGFLLDGGGDEWRSTPVFITDPASDAPENHDIMAGHLGLAGDLQEDLVGFIAGDFSSQPQDVLQIEFLGLSRFKSGKEQYLRQQTLRLYRLQAGGTVAESLSDGVWNALPASVASWRGSARGVEWRMDRRQIDEVLAKPLWAFGIQRVAREVYFDRTSFVYLPTLGRQSPSGYQVQRCAVESKENFDLRFQNIVASDVSGDHAETLFGVVRLAYEALQSLLRIQPMPGSAIPVIISQDKFTSVIFGVPRTRDAVFYRGINLQLTPSIAADLDLQRYSHVFAVVFADLMLGLLRHHNPERQDWLREWLKETILQHAHARFIGEASWLAGFADGVADFVRSSQEDAGLRERYERLAEPFTDKRQKNAYLAVTSAQMYAASAVAQSHILPHHLWRAWLVPGDYISVLGQQLAETDPAAAEALDGLVDGWLYSAPFQKEFSKSIVTDLDYDGLPKFFESARQLDPDMIDTDEDGWSDYAEYVDGSDPRDKAKTPGKIVADGHFGDWQELLPTQVKLHRDQSDPLCSEAAAIQASIGIVDSAHLILAGLPKVPWQGDEELSWEFHVNFVRSRKQIIVRAQVGSTAIEVLDAISLKPLLTIPVAVPVGIFATELAIHSSVLGIDSDLSRRRAVKYRAAIVSEGDSRRICDQTAWLYPLTHTE